MGSLYAVMDADLGLVLLSLAEVLNPAVVGAAKVGLLGIGTTTAVLGIKRTTLASPCRTPG